MSRKRRKKRVPVVEETLPAEVFLYLQTLSRIGMFLSVLGFTIMLLAGPSVKYGNPPRYTFIFYFVFFLLTATGAYFVYRINKVAQLRFPTLTTGPTIKISDYRVIRGATVRALTVVTFMPLFALVPILVRYGYIAAVSDWISSLLPTKEVLGQKTSVGLTFVILALISGAIGNFGTDLIRFLVRKIVAQKQK